MAGGAGGGRCPPQAVRDRRRPRRRGRVPQRRAGDRARQGGREHLAGRHAAGPDRARHPRVGRDARGGAGRRRRRRAAATRCSAACCPRPGRRCSCAATGSTWPRSCRRRTTPTRTTGSSSSGPRAPSSTTRRRPRSSSCSTRRPRARLGRVRELHGAPADYLRELEARFADLRLDGIKVLLDCANGATLQGRARDLPSPRGRRSTRSRSSRTGATSTSTAARRTSRRSRCRLDDHDVGFAFDGDGDRVLAVDRRGGVVDGDELLALAALHLREHERLPGNGVAVTVMTNYGFHSGDARRTASRWRPRRSATATCSPSCSSAAGRSAASSRATSSTRASCPPATAPRRRCWRSRRSPAATSATATRWRSSRSGCSTCGWPNRDALDGADDVWAAVEEAGERLNGRGRVLVRSSGTEPLIRVMVEAPDERECEEIVAAAGENRRGKVRLNRSCAGSSDTSGRANAATCCWRD